LFLVVLLAGCRTTDLSDSTDLSHSSDYTPSPVAVEVFHSMRIPAHRVKLSLGIDRSLTIEIEDRGKEPRISVREIDSDGFARVQSLLQEIDWKQVASDAVMGADGTAVLVNHSGCEYSLWTPSYNTTKRRLGKLHELQLLLFRSAGLSDTGLPDYPTTENKMLRINRLPAASRNDFRSYNL